MVFANLTVEDNLELGAYRRKDRPAIRADRDQVFQLFPRLLERRRQPAGTLSGGSSRCWRSAAPSCRDRGSCCSTSRRWGSRPSWCARSSGPSARSTSAASPCCWSSRTRTCALSVAGRGYVLGDRPGAIRGRRASSARERRRQEGLSRRLTSSERRQKIAAPPREIAPSGVRGVSDSTRVNRGRNAPHARLALHRARDGRG